MNEFKNVFSPFTFGNVTVKNRIEFSPAIPCLASPDGFVTRELIEFFQSLARGGAGIVTIGDTAIDFKYGKDHDAQLNMGDDRVIPGLSTLVEAVQRYGAKISMELNHGGRFAAPGLLEGRNPIGPSPIPSAAEEMFAGLEGRRKVQITEMNQDMIDIAVDQYAMAAYRCMMAGFEMVMIHNAHGHLLSQFLSPYSNKRTDSYGGGLENRAKFAVEVYNAIRKKVGNKLAIEMRVSATEHVKGGMELNDTIEFIKMVEDKIDLVHVSVGLLTDPMTIPHMIQPTYLPHGYNVHFAEAIKKAIRKPVVAVGSIDMEMADRIIAEEKCDIVAMARNLIADTDYVNKYRRGEEDKIRPCVRCNTCTHTVAHFYPIRCAVNPVIGREVEYKNILDAKIKKKVVIAGGGPAGMEAAQMAVSRGHDVTLLEKEKELGGALILAAAPPFKADMRRYLDWMIKTTLNTPGIKIKFSTEATAETIKAEKPDVLIISAGAVPIDIKIPGVDGSNVVSAGDVDLGKVTVGNNVVVAGGGLTGCETALHLAQQGKKVTVIDMVGQMELAADAPILNKLGLMGLMMRHGVVLRTEVKLEEISKTEVTVIDKQWNRHMIPADTVVLSLGYRAKIETVTELQGLAKDVYVIGDCMKARNLRYAIQDAFNVAVEI
jgi:2,4-dienoyl-CoA reductase-like NADH-dependent reductase (Old Yellow Enzyme family)/NADPH-dependent 2,4-dienoyl-CoA reductase/sulfur reductase-like enzyme